MSKDNDLVMNVVTRTSDLVSACKRFEDVDYITVDTEFIRDNTYWPQVCLIQVASQDEAIAVDPLSKELDLDPVSQASDQRRCRQGIPRRAAGYRDILSIGRGNTGAPL